MAEHMSKVIFPHRGVFCEVFGTKPPATVRAVGTQRAQRSWSHMVLEGFLEEERKVEVGGLGVGALGRDCKVGMRPPDLVTKGMQLGFIRDLGAGAGSGGR